MADRASFDTSVEAQPLRSGGMPIDPRTTKDLSRIQAALLCLLDAYRQVGYSMSPLEAQKLAYLLQAAGEDLRLRFEAHLYGPYAHALTKALEGLEGHYLRGLGDQQASRAVFELMPGAGQEAAAMVEREANGLAKRLDRVLKLVEGFETPYGLELLASVHWLAWHPKSDAGAARDAESATEALRRWNARKAKRYDRHHVTVAWDQLASQGWLPESASSGH